MKKVGSHTINSIFIEIGNDDKAKVLNNLTEKGKWLNKAKIEVQKVSSEIIDFVTKKVNEV